MFSSAVSAGDIALASQYNNLRKDAMLHSGARSFTYDSQGRVATSTDTSTGVVLTYTYSVAYGDIASTTDGTKTWTYNYNSKRQLTSISEA